MLNDDPQSGKPVEVESEYIQTLNENDQSYTRDSQHQNIPNQALTKPFIPALMCDFQTLY